MHEYNTIISNLVKRSKCIYVPCRHSSDGGGGGEGSSSSSSSSGGRARAYVSVVLARRWPSGGRPGGRGKSPEKPKRRGVGRAVSAERRRPASSAGDARGWPTGRAAGQWRGPRLAHGKGSPPRSGSRPTGPLALDPAPPPRHETSARAHTCRRCSAENGYTAAEVAGRTNRRTGRNVRAENGSSSPPPPPPPRYIYFYLGFFFFFAQIIPPRWK